MKRIRSFHVANATVGLFLIALCAFALLSTEAAASLEGGDGDKFTDPGVGDDGGDGGAAFGPLTGWIVKALWIVAGARLL